MKKANLAPEFLYHATLRSNLDSIKESGILRANYGAIHGAMEYAPPEKAVYLSTSEESGNLNSALFDKEGPETEVIVLRIRASDLRQDAFYPDDAFFYKLDETFCEDAEDLAEDPAELREFIKEMTAAFCDLSGLDPKEGARTLMAFLRSEGTADEYAVIARKMGGFQYLLRQGEAAYLGDVPASAILDWEFHPDSKVKLGLARLHRP
jgi:hypothetical protein